MKFRYLILVDDGDIWGTNDRDEALAAVESCQVVDVKEGLDLGTGDDIDEYEPPEVEEDDDEQDASE